MLPSAGAPVQLPFFLQSRKGSLITLLQGHVQLQQRAGFGGRDFCAFITAVVDLEFDLAESLQALNAFVPSKLCSYIQQMTIFSGFTETRSHSF
jgi:hypothetical protein